MYVSCQRLVHDQHLQHQGWAAVTANLDDITRSMSVMCAFEDIAFFNTFEVRDVSTAYQLVL
jgi:hypothetical protein